MFVAESSSEHAAAAWSSAEPSVGNSRGVGTAERYDLRLLLSYLGAIWMSKTTLVLDLLLSLTARRAGRLSTRACQATSAVHKLLLMSMTVLTLNLSTLEFVLWAEEAKQLHERAGCVCCSNTCGEAMAATLSAGVSGGVGGCCSSGC